AFLPGSDEAPTPRTSAGRGQHFAELMFKRRLPGVEGQANPQGPEPAAAELGPAQLDQILLRRDDQSLLRQPRRPGSPARGVAWQIGVVIREFAKQPQVRPQIYHG